MHLFGLDLETIQQVRGQTCEELNGTHECPRDWCGNAC